jgi:hypothetical protein
MTDTNTSSENANLQNVASNGPLAGAPRASANANTSDSKTRRTKKTNGSLPKGNYTNATPPQTTTKKDLLRKYENGQRIDIKLPSKMGPEAYTHIAHKFRYTEIDDSARHSIPMSYISFLQQHYYELVLDKYMPIGRIFSVGADLSFALQTTEDDAKIASRVYSMRQQNTAIDKLEQLRYHTLTKTLKRTLLEWCTCELRPQSDYTCSCNLTRLRDADQFMSIFNTLNPTILDKGPLNEPVHNIEFSNLEQILDTMSESATPEPSVAYIAFHDYQHAFRQGNLQYALPDQEGTITFSTIKRDYRRVDPANTHRTAFSTETYASAIIDYTVSGGLRNEPELVLNTAEYNWQVKTPGYTAMFTVVESFPYGKHRFILVEVRLIEDVIKTIPSFTALYSPPFAEFLPRYQKPNTFIDPSTVVVNTIAALTQILGSIASKITNYYEILRYSPRDGELEVRWNDMNHKSKNPNSAVVRIDTLIEFVRLITGKTDPKQVVDAVRMVIRDKSKDKKLSPKDLIGIQEAAKMALAISADIVKDIYNYALTDANVVEATRIQKEKTPTKIDRTMLKIILGTFCIISIMLTAGFLFLHAEKFYDEYVAEQTYQEYQYNITLGQEHIQHNVQYSKHHEPPNHRTHQRTLIGVAQGAEYINGSWVIQHAAETSWAAAAITITLLLLYRLYRRCRKVALREPPRRQWIDGCCVTELDRLDWRNINSKSKFTSKDPRYDIYKYSSGLDAYLGMGCECKKTKYAGQIAPLTIRAKGDQPVIKHACNLTKMSACIRACSNQVFADPHVIHLWQKELKYIFNDLIEYMNENPTTVNYYKWLEKYPIQYRQKLAVAQSLHDSGEDSFFYGGMSKIEKQFSEVIPGAIGCDELKERMICCPHDTKKLMANAFCWTMETVAMNCIPEYCGSKNWDEIAADLDHLEASIPNPIWMCADGSGFDTTQHLEILQCFNEQIARLLVYADLTIEGPNDKNDIMKAFDESLILRVSVTQGLFGYETEGTRASGDGWTSFANTLLMISYWRFIFREAGLKPVRNGSFIYGMKAKGDDTLSCIPGDSKMAVERSVSKYMAQDKKPQIKGLGQICKFVKYGPLEEMDFLSSYFIPTSNGYRMVRKPARVFQLTPWSTKFVEHSPERLSRELCWSNGMCILSWATGLPIFESYGRMLIRVSGLTTGTLHLEWGDEGRVFPDRIGDREAALDWFFNKFDITTSDVDKLEHMFDSNNHQLAVFEDVIFEKFYIEG